MYWNIHNHKRQYPPPFLICTDIIISMRYLLLHRYILFERKKFLTFYVEEIRSLFDSLRK